jgi:hypothetical protein
VGLFFQEKNNPRRTTSHNLQKWPILLPYARPPHGFFWQYLSQKSSYKTGAQTQLGVRIRRILLSRAVPYFPRSHQHRHPFGRTGGATMKAAAARR